MSFVTEILEEKPPVLIVSEKNHQLIQLLKQHLKKYKADVFYSPELPKKLTRFEYIFFLNEEKIPKKNLIEKHKKVTLIYINNEELTKTALKQLQGSNLKIVSILGDRILDSHVDKILWFTFSQAKETFLRLTAAKNIPLPKKVWLLPKFKMPKRKKIILTFIFLFLFFHIAFFPLLFASTFLFYKASKNLKQGDFSGSEKNYESGQKLFLTAKTIYKIPRVTFLIFSLTFPDFLFKNTDRAGITVQKSLNLQKNSREVLKLILNKNKTTDEKALLLLRFETIKRDIKTIEENLNNLAQEIPTSLPNSKSIKKDLVQYTDVIFRIKRILPYIDSILAKNTEKNYLLLFANNMELRPGGGFIGSFGLMKVKDYTVEEIKIYDVYDADGQLNAHVEPPKAIRNYLNQPNWFLRDSAFSPDLLENYAQAKFFLEKEMGFTNFSGGFLITTTAVQNILGAFPEIYLPDFNEKINQKNFYLKTQYYSEKNFFPGSIQKKNFLGSLTQTILLDLENASLTELAKALKKSLDEKQISLYFDDSKLQTVLDTFYWSGRTIQPSCSTEAPTCLSDYIFPFDANLGLNKVNFFVTRHTNMKVTFDEQGKIINSFSIQFNNDSADVFPGGNYRNFFQVYLPKNSAIKKISKDGVLIENFSEETGVYKKIGFILDIPTKTSTEIIIDYDPGEKLKKGRNIYQLIVQKQIGASNSDLGLELIIDKKIHLLNQNFPALVKDNRIIYNTSLSTDKIFLVELIKE
ncbi:hypothetical protein A2767_06985 [Candidatus Roizmanbacteria bacterium RIFCSPHIGHO2_01_FULL_35_10]|uniref:DUF4012 domain-containing protein n=1 Tax=Candidatus Roizmanbacteria bacterium RIFCSPLOWO2_01_FULL_35_13 TaxID=1802055 RepID=A0A1F7I879_9BACT|nr:MAG: hypothetical protein A2767_06985 [Candidatus Roizmanbacteria bacterium RIFCSPHIGHO2_01_FULL_35_10]OGK39571.1 MAG: hypothetical protein A3A74_06625 [Candidatus Roizmanbacteria bacterium RIFCSPLOWO2_01_FULL_35_13]